MKFLASFFALTARVYASSASPPPVLDVRRRGSGSCPASISALEGNLFVDASGELVSGTRTEQDRMYPLVNFVELGGAWIRNLELDTGSAIPWLYPEATGGTAGVDPVVPAVNFNYTYEFGGISGTLHRGPVKIGNVDLGQMDIGYAQGHDYPDPYSWGINGIIGLSFPDPLPKAMTPFSTDPVVAKIPIFSVATTFVGGMMEIAWNFGGITRNRVDPAALVGVPVRVPGEDTGDTILMSWTVRLEAVSYGDGQSLKIGDDFWVLVDSGTPTTLLPGATVLSLYQQVGKEGTDWHQDVDGRFWLSQAAGNSFKDIVFDLGNDRKWVQSGKHYASVNAVPRFTSFSNETKWYFGSVQVMEPKSVIGTLGKTFFANNVVAFDSRGATVKKSVMYGCPSIRVAPVLGST